MGKKVLSFVGVIMLVAAVYFGWLKFHDIFSSNSSKNNSASQQDNQPVGFDKTKYSTEEPGSIWWVVNKTRPLPDGYEPSDLVVPGVKLRLSPREQQMQFSQTATPDLITMFKAASNDGVKLVFDSGYRSQALQKKLYDSYVAQDGQDKADTYSARPGTSEHQTGLAFDAVSEELKCFLEICFENQPEGKWLRENSYKYGFIIRYPEGKETVTGYQYEPWHMRYVGVDLATEMHNQGIQTLEEFFGLPAAPNYPQ